MDTVSSLIVLIRVLPRPLSQKHLFFSGDPSCLCRIWKSYFSSENIIFQWTNQRRQFQNDQTPMYGTNLSKYRVIQNKGPPLPGRNKKYSMKSDNSIFKYNLFNNYLESFMLHKR